MSHSLMQNDYTTMKQSERTLYDQNSIIERFSIECSKTKPKVTTLANHNRRKQHKEPIRTRSKYMQPESSAGKCMQPNHNGFSLASDWLRKWREFCEPIREHSKAKPRQMRITFDTQLKTALKSFIYY